MSDLAYAVQRSLLCSAGIRPGRTAGARVGRVRCVAAPADVDLEQSGLKYLSEEARERATQKKANKFEKVKVRAWWWQW